MPSVAWLKMLRDMQNSKLQTNKQFFIQMPVRRLNGTSLSTRKNGSCNFTRFYGKRSSVWNLQRRSNKKYFLMDMSQQEINGRGYFNHRQTRDIWTCSQIIQRNVFLFSCPKRKCWKFTKVTVKSESYREKQTHPCFISEISNTKIPFCLV